MGRMRMRLLIGVWHGVGVHVAVNAAMNANVIANAGGVVV